MQLRSVWTQGPFTAVVLLALLILPAWSQQPGPGPAPGPGSDASSYVRFGIANGAAGDLAAAIAAFNQAIKIDPRYAPAYYNRGFAHALENQPDEAIADYGQTIQLSPSYKQAYYQRGGLRGRKGDFAGALSDFSTVIKLDPKYAPAYYNRGHVEYFQGDLTAAASQVDQALSLDPNSTYSYFIRGLIRHAEGEKTEAASDFQKSAGLGFPYASLWLWITEMENNQPALAQQDLANALSNDSSIKGNAWPSPILNFLLKKITQDQLLAAAGPSAADPDQHCEAWFYIGMAKRLAGDLAGARDALTKAVATGATGSEEFVEARRELARLTSP